LTRSPFRSILTRLQQTSQIHRTALWTILLTGCAGFFFIQGRSDFAQAITTLSESSSQWILVVVCSQFLVLALAAATYQIMLRHTGHSLGFNRLFALHLERKVIGTIMPGGGPASVYVFVRGLGRDRVSSDDALFTIGARSLTGFAAFVSFLLPAMVLAQPQGALLAGALAVIVGFVVIASSVLLVFREPRTIQWIARHIPQRVATLIEHARGHQLGLNHLTMPYLLALISQLASIITLAAALKALGHTPSVVSILAAYTVGTTAVTLAPAFQGIGLVEVSMAFTLQQFGVPPGVAIGATLLFRVGTVWFPLLLGALYQTRRWIPSIGTAGRLVRPQQQPGRTPMNLYFKGGIKALVVAGALMVVL
jgi:uncharacterized protein (TIRG00374 family)